MESYRSKVDELSSQLSEQSYETKRATMSENETKRHLTCKIRDLNMRIESLEEEVILDAVWGGQLAKFEV